jgi:3-oxoacyl-(acyl-carrier-protein) synthase
VYCEVTGYASRGNAFHMTGLRPDGLEMAEAIMDALRQGGTGPGDVDYVNAHGSGTRQNDIHETAALKRALGAHAHGVPVSSIKSMVGHSLGGIGAIEIAASALAIEHGVAPPTANLTTPDPECDLDYVPRTARAVPIDVALCTGSGFGGFQSAIVLSRRDEALA